MQDSQSPGASSSDVQSRLSSSAGARCEGRDIPGYLNKRLITGPLPLRFGGEERTPSELVSDYESAAAEYGASGYLFALAAHLCACVVPIWAGGTNEQHDAWLIPLAAGRWIGACAMSERAAGSDIHAISCQARRTIGGYILNGRKSYVTNAPNADLFLLYAKTAWDSGPFGISAFGVPRASIGAVVHELPEKTGLAGAEWGELELTDCFVPDHSRVGGEGAGAAIFHASMQWERLVMSAIALGNMQRSTELCIQYARRREQFGKLLGRHQAMAHRLVEMKLRLERSRALLYHAASRFDRLGDRDAVVSLAKLSVMEDAVASGLDAVQVLGAQGLDPNVRSEQLLMDSLLMRLASGSSEIQRELLARHLGLY